MADKHETVISEFSCGDCGCDVWKISIVHHADGRTLMSFCCANEECVERKRQLVGAGEDDVICWDEIDITGQGYDPDDIDGKTTFLPGLGIN